MSYIKKIGKILKRVERRKKKEELFAKRCREVFRTALSLPLYYGVLKFLFFLVFLDFKKKLINKLIVGRHVSVGPVN